MRQFSVNKHETAGFTSIQKEMQEWCYDIADHVVLFQRMGVIISNTRVKKKKKKTFRIFIFHSLRLHLVASHIIPNQPYKRDGSRVKRPSPESTKQKTLVIFVSKETKAVLDGTMYPQQRRSKRKRKKRMHGAKHLYHLTLLLPSAKSRNHVHATQHYTLDNTTTTLIYLFKFKSKQLRRQKGWHYCICACMKVCVCVHVCERVVPQRLVVCQLYISLKQFHFLSLRYGFMRFSFHFCKWHQKNVRPSDCLATPSTYLAVM